jgi:hypothetical protein
MIQRIQTVYILLFCIVMFIASITPFASIIYEKDSIYFLYPTGWQSQSSLDGFNTYPFFTSYLVSISFAILMLVNYKKRSKQLKYGKICYFFVLLTLVIMFLELSNGLENMKIINNDGVQYLYSMYLLIASLPIIFLANRAIKKDDKLVKSLDRLR